MKRIILKSTRISEVSILTVIFLLFNSAAQAQGPPIFTDTPIMLGLEGRGLRTFGNYVSRENGNSYVHPFAVPYNISSKWQVGLIAPLVNVSPQNVNSRFGLGDVRVFTKYQLIQKDGKGKTFRTLIKLTETFPTGNSSDNPPLGSGAYQTTIGLVNGYVTTQYGIYGEVAYNLTSDGLPDNLIYNLAFGLPLLPQQYPPKQLNLFLEFNGNYTTEERHALFISPGVQWIGGKRFLLESGLQLPLIEEVPDKQKTNFRFRLGTRILIF